MRVEIFSTAPLPSRLRSPLVIPWRHRTFLFRRRRQKASGIGTTTTNNTGKFRGLGGRTVLKARKHDGHQLPSPVRKFTLSQGVKRKQVSLQEGSNHVYDHDHDPYRYVLNSNKDPGAGLLAISETVDHFHQKRRLRKMQAIKRKQQMKVVDVSETPTLPVSPCKRTPSKDMVLRATGLLTISPISRPAAKKQRFF